MATFVNDTMTEGSNTTLQSHTGEVGATWAKITGYTMDATINASTDRLHATGATTYAGYYASGVPASADYDVEADLHVVTDDGDSDPWAILGRLDHLAASDTFYYVSYNASANQWGLYKAVSGTYTELGTFSQTLTAGNSYRAKLEMRGTAVKAFVDGVQRISVTDSDVTTAGRAGLYLNRSDGTVGHHLDNFLANDTIFAPLFFPRHQPHRRRPSRILPY